MVILPICLKAMLVSAWEINLKVIKLMKAIEHLVGLVTIEKPIGNLIFKNYLNI